VKLTLGIDEAGRGPVIGPMVLAAVCVDTRGAQSLSRAGVRDSKHYGASEQARARRAELAALIRRRAVHCDVWVVDVAEVDRRVRRNELNVLEREVACRLIDRAPSTHRIVADGKILFDALRYKYSHLEAYNSGESRHCAVAAASILAKVRRDAIFARIAQRYAGEFGQIDGGGYVNAATRRFLRAYARKHNRLPPEARRSWPHTDLADILGKRYDPFADLPAVDAAPPQPSLF
jgi:ribonuclease HII